MMNNVPIEPRLDYDDLKGRLTIQKLIGLEEDARLAENNFYAAVRALKLGVKFFAVFFVFILFVAHLMAPGFASVYQGEGQLYWAGNSTHVT